MSWSCEVFVGSAVGKATFEEAHFVIDPEWGDFPEGVWKWAEGFVVFVDGTGSGMATGALFESGDVIGNGCEPREIGDVPAVGDVFAGAGDGVRLAG